MSDHHLRSSPLWYNDSLIRVENRPVQVSIRTGSSKE